MAYLEKNMRLRRHAGPYGNGRRFYTSRDMAIVKRDQAAHQAQINRGEKPDHANQAIYVCGCGWEGCFIHRGHKNNR